MALFHVYATDDPETSIVSLPTVKDVTTTSFGLVIAYILPGLAGLYGLTFWSSSLKRIAQTFYTAQSDLGLSLMVLAASVIVGLQLNAVRFLLYERALCRTQRLPPNIFKTIQNQETLLPVLTSTLEENFRYHQFFGSMTLVLPLLQAGWLKYMNPNVEHVGFVSGATLLTLSIALLMFMHHEINRGIAGIKDYLWCMDFWKKLGQRVGKRRAKTAVWVATVVLVVVYAVWLYLYQAVMNRPLTLLLVLGFTTLEVITGANAIVALRRYVERLTSFSK